MATRSILIVEDESLIAMMLEDFIDSLGHQVAGTEDTVEGALAQAEAGGFDLAILDVHLHGRSCWPVADALADRDIPFILATGGHTEAPPERHATAPVLSKPFTLNGIEQAIDSVA
ncbi:response regulator [Sphingomonas sp. CGMCC 1.13654]|uniref:Response regulator n=1 Tax=Sphingomonas chungangi TaxID=2683589 RepID=A0A838LAH0_9SPHN|nr:response regulator [Sphingomonas chungangi]MBA2935705.1 response regulator [Sphingomonas chungangi]MVW54395.1 response regulator [Sphingomonas chungangi]